MYRFYRACVDWPRNDVLELLSMIDLARSISRGTFLKYVDREELADIARTLGYASHPSQGLTMAGDCHVGYHRSTLYGKPVYFFRWSSIEHVFTEEQ